MHLFTSAPFLALSARREMLTLPIIIWGAVGGAFLGTVLSLVGRRIPGVFLKHLKGAAANSPEGAVTLAELGMEKNFLLKRALGDGKPLRKYVSLSNEADFVKFTPNSSRFARILRKIFSLPEPQERTRIDFNQAKFYITDDDRYTAEVRYNGKGADGLGIILSLILLAVLGAVLHWVLPELITMLEGLFTQKL